jgi:hypothetical protein
MNPRDPLAIDWDQSIINIIGNDQNTAPTMMQNISKKYFHLGGIASSEWMHSIRAVGDMLGADHSGHGINTTGHVTYRPLIAVSPFVLALSVCYSKRTL